ncbi:MAG: RNA-binding cell elongation regulator Jag/EloR [Candidatus Desulfatibia sp.]|jgi:spoIIIJ-associated protein|uniref:RNA-binding cell elongation regulator Jag/EloR n=1 Tax=Candidatus Desulfatibia sp. TaxID=3101189 RepID=UPI002F3094A1
MSPCFEFEDKSVEKAIQKACAELNIPAEELQHDVISYGSTGIFGLVGTKKARIRVTMPEPAPELGPEAPDKVISDEWSKKQTKAEAETIKSAASREYIPDPVEDDSTEIGKDALQRIVDLITTDAKISVKEGRGRIFFNVNGGETGVLIGRRGQTLEAIQYLVEKMVNKRSTKRIRVQVDVEGYLQNRRFGLQKRARQQADKAKRTGKPATMGQMTAHDRRIVHLALKDDGAVRTQSMGEGYLRELVVYPKKNSGR